MSHRPFARFLHRQRQLINIGILAQLSANANKQLNSRLAKRRDNVERFVQIRGKFNCYALQRISFKSGVLTTLLLKPFGSLP